ncbi:Dabb family protein, partial [Mycobacterium kansasii]
DNLSSNAANKRKVVEHICLLKAKDSLSEQEEKDMLDYLYTSQYHMRGIVTISVGRTTEQNPENYTHGMCMRFHKKEDLAKFYDSP